MSIALPRTFSFHRNDIQLPHTPEPQSQAELEAFEPPPPPRQTFKVRRRKAESIPRDIIADIEGDGLPIFEMTEADSASSPDSNASDSIDLLPGYLAPHATRLPLLSPPKTPVSQITDDPREAQIYAWHNRPLSACSDFSDSSASSRDSRDPLADFGCTSPDTDFDPFTYDPKMSLPIYSPEIASTSPTFKRAKMQQEAKWTPEMDNHLWLTYLKYLQDPELTPFKMLPGTAPPLGVCGRVAREAKHSWKGARPAGLIIDDGHETIRPQQAHTWSHWPSGESGTRKRLRKLCKRTPSLSAHYQRLMQARTPSPFQSSSSEGPGSDAQPPSFVPLKSEVPEPPISEDMVHDLPTDAPFGLLPHNPAQRSRPNGWFERAGRSQAHQKSKSLQIALGRCNTSSELASPFTASSSSRPNLSTTQSLGRNLGAQYGDSQTPLKSPLELHAPVPTNRSLKRRFGILDSSPANLTRLDEIFRPPPPSDQSSRIARERAFSLGAVYDGARQDPFSSGLPFQPQSIDDVFEKAANPRLNVEPEARLGSPFAVPATRPHFNTFPRQFTPLGSELPRQEFRPNFSLEGKFRELAAQECRRQS